MRRIVTWVVVAAVAALGLAAGIDALRGGEEPEPVAATETERASTGPLEPPERTLDVAGGDLRRAGVPEGRLVYTDDECSVRVLLLPDLAERPAHDVTACVPGRSGFVLGSPGGTIRAECTRGRLVLESGSFDDRDVYARARGCGAAWKPDGTVTFVQDGGVRRFVRCPGERPTAPLLCSRLVLSRAALARQLRGNFWFGPSPRIEELQWLTNQRFAAVVRGLSGAFPDHLAIFEHGRIVRVPTFSYADLRGLRPSPSGRLVAAYDERRGRIAVVNLAGWPVDLALDTGHGIAWSPDEEWIAEATEGGISVFRADEDSPELIRIPVVARDVLWTGPRPPRPITMREDARARRSR